MIDLDVFTVDGLHVKACNKPGTGAFVHEGILGVETV